MRNTLEAQSLPSCIIYPPPTPLCLLALSAVCPTLLQDERSCSLIGQICIYFVSMSIPNLTIPSCARFHSSFNNRTLCFCFSLPLSPYFPLSVFLSIYYAIFIFSFNFRFEFLAAAPKYATLFCHSNYVYDVSNAQRFGHSFWDLFIYLSLATFLSLNEFMAHFAWHSLSLSRDLSFHSSPAASRSLRHSLHCPGTPTHPLSLILCGALRAQV